MPEVSVVLGSDSDLPGMRECFSVLEEFGVSFEIVVSSAHRSPERTMEYTRTLKERGVKVVIAVAGGAAHLPGVVASLTTLPVIGVPVVTGLAGGLDSLLSIVQMPAGVPVAAMAAGKSGAANAALFSLAVLALLDTALAGKLDGYRKRLSGEVSEKGEKLRSLGYQEYVKTFEKKA
jgi:5-(carboxyamino)imidazole ribonucleotide mutase